MAKRALRGIAILIGLASAILAGAFTYHLHQAALVQLIIYMDPDHSPVALRWSAEQAFYAFHPTPTEAESLNAEAGARYAATVTDPDTARDLLEHLLANGVDIDARDTATGSGLTALQAVALARNERAVRLLLSHGADPSEPDARGRTAMELVRAAARNRADADFGAVLRLLERALARPAG